MKIVLLESLGISQELLDSYVKPLKEKGYEFAAYERNDDPAVQIEEAKDADILIIANMPLKAEVINACPNLKYIDVAFTGVDHVALDAAKAKGIKVSNASGYSTVAVAELTIAMMLDLLRRVPQVDAACRAGGSCSPRSRGTFPFPRQDPSPPSSRASLPPRLSHRDRRNRRAGRAFPWLAPYPGAPPTVRHDH